MKAIHQQMGVVNVSEYGLGINPFCHSLEPEKTTKKGTEATGTTRNTATSSMKVMYAWDREDAISNFTSLW